MKINSSGKHLPSENTRGEYRTEQRTERRVPQGTERRVPQGTERRAPQGTERRTPQGTERRTSQSAPRGAAPVSTARTAPRKSSVNVPPPTSHGRTNTRKKRKKSKAWIPVVAVLGALLLLCLVVYFIFLHYYSSMNIQREPMEISQSYVPTETEEESVEGATLLTDEEQAALDAELAARAKNVEFPNNDKVYNILLLGNDTRGSGVNERTDTMILVSINKETKQIVMSSFLRDIYIYIPGCGSNRLNAANVFGGPDLTMETIEQNFGVDIDNYAEVNFSAFIEIVDILGGVDVELTNAEIGQISGLYGSAGTYHLNGEQALDYCRIRKIDSDFGRTQRQRTVLEQLWSESKNMNLLEATSILNKILPYVTTDLSQADCLSLLTSALKMSSYEVSTLSIPADGTYSLAMINGMSVLRVDMDENASILKESIYGS